MEELSKLPTLPCERPPTSALRVQSIRAAHQHAEQLHRCHLRPRTQPVSALPSDLPTET